ncbi:MAG: RsmB/NOP family class I SAM-dependent RNA methyltransferase, partial [Cyclobacteriaceae bacterium]|nr:RsmB/NOP family class I SAM-dependent RNA methyltransferase [Cyclobacteriaceae bacterium]
MKALLGPEFPAFCVALEAPPPVSIRLHPKKKIAWPADPVPWADQGRYLSERPVFTLDPRLHAGAYYVQEASSLLLEQALKQSVDITQPLRVLDLCAAPGGKSTHLLSLLSGDSLLVSNEVIRSRASILAENIQKWGYSNVIVTQQDPRDFQRLTGFFDVIVTDAPCSGEGLFRKDPEAMKEWSPNNVELCSQRQRRIVNDVWPALKPGGVLIYSTCTYEEKENMEAVATLTQDFAAESVSLTLNPAWGIATLEKSGCIGYQCYPHRVKGEGFFISVLHKGTGDTST